MSRRWIAATLLAAAAGAFADVTPPPGAQQLQNIYPGARVQMDGARVRTLYGVPMTMGITPEQAASQFWAQHASAFGAGNLELSLWEVTTTQNGRFTVYSYHQTISGMPVEHGNGRLMVLNQPVPRVVYAAGTFATAPTGGFSDAVFTGVQVMAAIKRNPHYADLATWSPMAIPAVYQNDAGVATRVWKFEGSRPGRAFTFFVDMATGLLIEARSEIYNDNVIGTVKAMATPGLKPDITGNVPVATAISDLRMSVTGGNNAFSNVNGDFNITHAGTAAVTLTSNASAGRWIDVNPQGGSEISVSGPATPGVPASPLFNATPGGTNSPTTAQANLLIHGALIHNYYTDRAPGFTRLNKNIPGNTGVAGQCNAFYQSGDDSINFYNVGGGCNNSAYSSVIAHEYGHFVVNERDLGQGAFGEGLGDTSAVMLYDTGIIADTFYQTGTPIRDLVNNTRSYPCNGEVHDCGEVLGAFWYRVMQNFKNSYGTDTGRAKARDLQVAWYMVTTGGGTGGAFTPTSLIEVLTTDDTDGNLANGTPNYADICAASATRNVPCPPLTPFEYQYPAGRPEILVSNQPTVIQVNLVGVASTPVAGTGTINYSINGGSIVTTPMVEVTPNHYEATLPATNCTDLVDYYFSAQAASGATVRDPVGAPATKFHAVSAVGSSVAANFNFETNPGWTVTNSAGLTEGGWERGVPSTPSTQWSPPTDSDHSGQCWVTGLPANQDVDNGTTVLTTSAMNLAGYDRATLSYDRWFETLAPPPNPQPPHPPNYRVLVVQISANDGLNWSTVEFIGADTPKAWVHKEVEITNIVPLTSAIRVRFSVSDDPATYEVEAGVDAFKVIAYTCTSQCYADCNGDHVLNLSDFGCFQTKFATGDPYADCNGDGVRNLSDFGCFTTKFALGCP